MQYPVWQPSLKKLTIYLGICLAVCTAAFIALRVATAHLPAPYQPHITAPGTTPWRD